MTDTSLPSDTEAPIDAEFEPAEPVSSLGNQRLRPGWRAFGAVSLLFLVSAGLILANYGLIPGLKPRASDTAELQSEFQQMQADLNTRAQSLESLQSSVDGSLAELNRLNSNIQGVSNSVDTLRSNVEALENRLASESQAPAMGSENGSITTVNPLIIDRLEALENAITNFPDGQTSLQGDATRLNSELTTLRSDIETLRSELRAAQTVETEALDASVNSADAALALSAIEAAARRGRPFLSGYQRLITALPNERAVMALAPLAATGAPTLASLNDQFPALESRALDVDADTMGETAGFMRGLFGDSLKVRRDGELSSADLLEAANLALKEGDLEGSIVELEKLPPAPKAVFSEWLESANGRLSLENALEALRLVMIAEARP